jgi:excinuclease ABC subunit A
MASKNPNHKKIEGLDLIDKVINIDQSPIGRTPRSNPATYTEVFTEIRKLFTMTSESMIRGYKAGRFSFNVKADAAKPVKDLGAYYRNELLTRRVRRMRNLSGKFNRETLEFVSKENPFLTY